MGARAIIMFAVPAGLGGNLSIALNALNPILAAGGGGAPFRSRRVGSLNVISIIEARLVLSFLDCSLDPISITETRVN